ncbi:hypothetical protein [Acetobacter conturbans]|uniref:Secreted protein n=1 Tax=Acetobacter conturbans TaxID=1737472 RepID=A0ABX0K581_9PROT|nr:hypothetical protein [Acetobacter conturbans]NHN89315.1 hypothetical protein [Acetobacter conturbans]
MKRAVFATVTLLALGVAVKDVRAHTAPQTQVHPSVMPAQTISGPVAGQHCNATSSVGEKPNHSPATSSCITRKHEAVD